MIKNIFRSMLVGIAIFSAGSVIEGSEVTSREVEVRMAKVLDL